MRRVSFFCLCLAAPAFAADAETSAQIAHLKAASEDVRIEALRYLQTSLDPRLLDEFKALLVSEGNSIRRLAARGIGSRWWQLPRERVPEFVQALRRNEKSEFEDEVNMIQRALGLLQRDYRGPMFSRSQNQRWVIYERLGLPCLIDTKTGTEELLGWSPEGDGQIEAAWGNGPVQASVQWHAKKEMAALSILQGRKRSTVWVWRHTAGLHKLEPAAMARALGYTEDDLFWPAGFFTESKGWHGDELRFEVSFSTETKSEPADHTATLGWDAMKPRLRVISR